MCHSTLLRIFSVNHQFWNFKRSQVFSLITEFEILSLYAVQDLYASSSDAYIYQQVYWSYLHDKSEIPVFVWERERAGQKSSTIRKYTYSSLYTMPVGFELPVQCFLLRICFLHAFRWDTCARRSYQICSYSGVLICSRTLWCAHILAVTKSHLALCHELTCMCTVSVRQRGFIAV